MEFEIACDEDNRNYAAATHIRGERHGFVALAALRHTACDQEAQDVKLLTSGNL